MEVDSCGLGHGKGDCRAGDNTVADFIRHDWSWSTTYSGEDLADSTSTEGLSTKGVSDSRTSSVERHGGLWSVVESTNSSLRVWLIENILNLKNISRSSSNLVHGECLTSRVSEDTQSRVSNSSLRLGIGTST
jgi:hypothetical protein